MAGDLFQRVSAFVAEHPHSTADEVTAGVPTVRGAVPVVLRRLERAGILGRDRSTGEYWAYKQPYPLMTAGTAA